MPNNNCLMIECRSAEEVVQITAILRDRKMYNFIGWNTESLSYLRQMINGYLLKTSSIYIRVIHENKTMLFEINSLYEPPVQASNILEEIWSNEY